MHFAFFTSACTYISYFCMNFLIAWIIFILQFHTLEFSQNQVHFSSVQYQIYGCKIDGFADQVDVTYVSVTIHEHVKTKKNNWIALRPPHEIRLIDCANISLQCLGDQLLQMQLQVVVTANKYSRLQNRLIFFNRLTRNCLTFQIRVVA